MPKFSKKKFIKKHPWIEYGDDMPEKVRSGTKRMHAFKTARQQARKKAKKAKAEKKAKRPTKKEESVRAKKEKAQGGPRRKHRPTGKKRGRPSKRSASEQRAVSYTPGEHHSVSHRQQHTMDRHSQPTFRGLSAGPSEVDRGLERSPDPQDPRADSRNERWRQLIFMHQNQKEEPHPPKLSSSAESFIRWHDGMKDVALRKGWTIPSYEEARMLRKSIITGQDPSLHAQMSHLQIGV